MLTPFATPPDPGQLTEVAPGLHWLRMPLPMALDHVNIWVLDDRLQGGQGWTVIDTGLNTPAIRALWEDVLSGPLAAAPVERLVVTHHHPDHCGLTGWFAERGAEVHMPRAAYLMARSLQMDRHDHPPPAQTAYWRRLGLPEAEIAERAARPMRNFADGVAPLPPSYVRLTDGGQIRMGGRLWDIRLSEGHAPEQATFWCRDAALVISADQILPGITPNLGAWPTEPAADPVAAWLESLGALLPQARPDQLTLPGHRLPFLGLPERIEALVAHHHAALDRLRAALVQPMRGVDLFPVLFRRKVGEGELALAFAETLGHLNHLHARGEVRRTEDGPGGAWLWQLACDNVPRPEGG